MPAKIARVSTAANRTSREDTMTVVVLCVDAVYIYANDDQHYPSTLNIH